MKTYNTLLIVTLTLMLVITAPAPAETITIFDSNSVIETGQVYDTVVVNGDGTVVDMTGGDVNNLIVMDSAEFNMSGGEIHKDFQGYNESKLNFIGGLISNSNRTCIYQQCSMNVIGNMDLSRIEMHGSSTLKISSNLSKLFGIKCWKY